MTKKINHSTQLLAALRSTFKSPRKDADIILVVQKKKIAVHRLILGLQSPILYNMVHHQKFVNSEKKELHISAPLEAFELILEYLYTGTVSLEKKEFEVIFDMATLSHRFKLKELEKVIMDTLKQEMDVKNLHSIIKVVEKSEFSTYAGELNKACKNLLAKQYEKFLELESFIELNLKEMSRLISHSILCLPIIKQFQLISKWILANQEKNENAKELLDFVNLSKFSNWQIIKIVEPTKLYSNDHLMEVMMNRITDVEPESLESSCVRKTFYKRTWQHGAEIVIDLGKVTAINCIKFDLPTLKRVNYTVYTAKNEAIKKDADPEAYAKYWRKVKSYISCRYSQVVYLTSAVNVKFIRIQGPDWIDNFEALKLSTLPAFKNGIPYLTENLFNLETAYIYTTADQAAINQIALDQNNQESGGSTYYTENTHMGIRLNQQQYLRKVCLHLSDFNDRKYSFKVAVYKAPNLKGQNFNFHDVNGRVTIQLHPQEYTSIWITSHTNNPVRLVRIEGSA